MENLQSLNDDVCPEMKAEIKREHEEIDLAFQNPFITEDECRQMTRASQNMQKQAYFQKVLFLLASIKKFKNTHYFIPLKVAMNYLEINTNEPYCVFLQQFFDDFVLGEIPIMLRSDSQTDTKKDLMMYRINTNDVEVYLSETGFKLLSMHKTGSMMALAFKTYFIHTESYLVQQKILKNFEKNKIRWCEIIDKMAIIESDPQARLTQIEEHFILLTRYAQTIQPCFIPLKCALKWLNVHKKKSWYLVVHRFVNYFTKCPSPIMFKATDVNDDSADYDIYQKGNNSKHVEIFMSINGFKKLCMYINGRESIFIKRYFIQMELQSLEYYGSQKID